KCMPKKLLNSALYILVFFKSIYLKSSCSNPLQLINQFLVNRAAQKMIGKVTNIFSNIELSEIIAKYITIGTGATDQKGSYRLEFLSITLPI
mgnify:CR=1